MPEENSPQRSFNIFCSECNTQVEGRVIASANHAFKSDALNPIDQEDAPYTALVYSIAICPKCDSPFFIRESLYGIPGEVESVTEETLLYPPPTRTSFEGIPDPVKRAYQQALRCYSSSSFDACALMCRRSLEALCKAFGLNNGTLQDKLEKLAEQRTIEARLVDWAHGIRIVGNEAAHDTDTELSKEDAKDALDFTEALLTYVFVLNERFAAFSARRKQSAASSR
jgi:hypothetical protein